ncbi:MAG: TetR/AcrR family transcriptional regulator [Mariprofundales bacterium]
MNKACKISNAETTRQKILKVAAEEIHLHGFQACNISVIISNAKVSKGALYHHFSSKLDLGYAVIDEVFAPQHYAMWQPVFASDNPIRDIIQLFNFALNDMTGHCLERGCPLNNLAQEMSPIDEGFRLRINQIMVQWQTGIAQALQRGKKNSLVYQDVNPERTAIHLMASIEGAHGLAKNSQQITIFAECIHGLIDYVQRLGEKNDY